MGGTFPPHHPYNKESMKPHHPHDCDSCIFLGAVPNKDDAKEGAMVDLYFHPYEGHRTSECTLIARYGEDGDYSSGSCFSWGNPYLNEALRLADLKGLIVGDVRLNVLREQAQWLNHCEGDPDYKARIDERFHTERYFLS